MGRIKNGILGGFSGKVGTVVGYIVGEGAYIRGLPKPKKYTEKELLNQEKFKLVQRYLEPVKDLVKVGFKNYYTKTGGFRGAVSYTRKVALVQDDGGFYIDPALFKISGGDLPGAVNPSIAFYSPDQLKFDWDVSEVTYETASDQIMVLVYDMVDFNALIRIFNGAFRSDGTLSIRVPPEFGGKQPEVYIGFVAADRASQSDGQYLGKIAIPEIAAQT